MSKQAFDGIRSLEVGPTTVPTEILPGSQATVTTEDGNVEIVQWGETLRVSQQSRFTSQGRARQAGHVNINVSVTAASAKDATSTTIHYETASSSQNGDPDLEAHSENAEAPRKIIIRLPEGVAVKIKNHVNAPLSVGAIKGPLVIEQMVNGQIAVEEVTDVELKMLVNCHGYIHPTGKIKRGMMVNCDIRID